MTMLPDISKRSDQKELIDGKGIPDTEMIRNIRELDTFNLLTGNIAITLRLLGRLVKNETKEYHLADLGCGGGEFLLRADKWSKKRDLKLRLSGIDNNATAISYLKSRLNGNESISTFQADYKTFLNSVHQNIDFIHCSLFIHHLSDSEIIDLIQAAKQRNTILIINDLKRSLVAYYAAKLLTRLFNGTKLAKNDGSVSVLRAFKKEEIISLIAKTSSRIMFLWSVPFFRYIVVIAPD